MGFVMTEMLALHTVKYFLVIDFEATCDEPVNRFPQEMIEFPIVLVDAQSLNVVGEFHHFVRPLIYPKLSAFCSSLTGIQQNTVDQSLTFPDVLKLADQWIRQHCGEDLSNVYAVTYGNWDFGTLFAIQVKEYDLEIPFWGRRWIDLQDVFQKHFALSGKQIKMIEAFQYLGISLSGRLHSGIDDARKLATFLVELIKLNAGIGFAVNDNDELRGNAPSVEEKFGDWKCSRCNFLNFARRTFCKDCGATRAADAVTVPRTAPSFQSETKPGDWNCGSCGFLNFARRGFCKECGATRPDDGTGTSYTATSQDNTYAPRGNFGYRQGQGQGQGQGGNFGGFRQYPPRQNAYGAPRQQGTYGTPRPAFGGGFNAGGGFSNPRMKPGDWRCSSCGFVNFARRSNCKQCSTDKPAQDEFAAPATFERQSRPGDWTCECGYHNFAHRDHCGRCNSAKP